MPNTFSQRAQKISPSQTLSISALSNRLRAEGRDVINLAVGQPDFPTPEHVKEAAAKAMRDNKTGYTAVDGTAELKQAVADKLKCENGLDYAGDQILVSCGAKHSLYNLCQALLNKGDEVITPAPFWLSYPELIKLAEGEPVILRAGMGQRFKINAQQLERSITKNTRLLMLNSPNNPSGMLYSRSELGELAEVLLQNPNIHICSDDIYEHFVFGAEPFANIVNVCPELQSRTVVINGVSKAFSMTGWRIGYAAGPAGLIAVMKKIQSQSTSNPCSISQEAARAALDGPLDCVAKMRETFAERRDWLGAALRKINGVETLMPDGSFYVFPNFSGVIERHPKVGNDLELAEYLLEKHHVAAVPGIAFGMVNHLRLSFATGMDELEKAVERIAEMAGEQA
ncbi:MAG: pyridoxal phosphate-dependent aminotransferase [Gammaproteobacteria bacterium]|nr:pyridoxal phosphate-dependent aminotransferase [Gammaproteobacteria bacterium]